MLLVNASAGPSKIHRLGLVAKEFISAGTQIWEYNERFDRTFSDEDLGKLSLNARQQVLYYGYFDLASRVYVLSSDDDRFTNHSEDPNTKDYGRYTVAVKDIYPGEEITCNYAELGLTQFKAAAPRVDNREEPIALAA
jgi:uncharacterized protein